ncbi:MULTISPECIES: hypothetical protein [Aerosakkonema]|uniref:hypothetical protein n=1 Tax=Aerosakkonema TaxID=1246629 RepID=UPI0035B972FA
MKLLIALLAVASIFLFSFSNWRRAVKIAFFLIVIEGALRKWVLPQASELIYFLKDFFLLGAYIKYYVAGGERKFPIKNNLVNAMIFMAAGWCLLQAFNPSLGSPIIGLFGLKTYLFYIPFIWMMPVLFPTEEELYKFLRSHLFLLIPVGILGVVQFFSPASSPINSYVQSEVAKVDVATFINSDLTAGGVRITGTFSYINNYAAYLLACFSLLLPLLSFKQSRWWRWATIAELLLWTVNSFMTGSRSTVFSAVIILVGYLGIRTLTNPYAVFRLFKPFLIPAVVVSMASLIWFRPAVDAFLNRTSAGRDIYDRIFGTLSEPFNYINLKGVDGYGAGATHLGGAALRLALNLPPGEAIPVGYEAEMGRIALELGVIGFIIWYALRVSIIISLFMVFWKLKRPFLRQLALTAFLLHAIWINGQLVFHHTFATYYWFSTGFIFLLPRLEQVMNWQEQLQWLNQNAQAAYLPDSPDRQSEFS